MLAERLKKKEGRFLKSTTKNKTTLLQRLNICDQKMNKNKWDYLLLDIKKRL